MRSLHANEGSGSARPSSAPPHTHTVHSSPCTAQGAALCVPQVFTTLIKLQMREHAAIDSADAGTLPMGSRVCLLNKVARRAHAHCP